MRSGRAVLGAAAIFVAAVIAPPPATAGAQDSEWTSFPGGIAPGATIAQIGEDDYYACTLGVIAGDPDTHRLYALTAGHCDHSDTKGQTVLYTEANSPDVARPLGTYIASRDTDGDTVGRGDELPLYTDAGVIEIQDRTPISSFKIAAVYPVRGVVTDRADLPYGTEVCKYGMRTGETCGPIQVASKYTITAKVRAIEGDSGSALYRKNNDGTVDIIGLTSSVDSGDETTEFFWIAPLLETLNLQVCGCAPN
ncbi:hypothetical protein ACNUDN_30365 [Mycobacterium sp. smrl_JER01]|uniref:hypothetical protein n=1 Tax=Mycobacterium sp. smrl_JER01 TaxID=3402633 RepID=UPI003AD0BF06